MHLQKRGGVQGGMVVSLFEAIQQIRHDDEILTTVLAGGSHSPGSHLPRPNWLPVLQNALAKKRPLRA